MRPALLYEVSLYASGSHRSCVESFIKQFGKFQGKMNRVKKCARTYLSCNTRMEFFSIHGCEGIRIKIIDLATRRYITLWDHEVFKLICQIDAYESVEESHPSSWKELFSQTFSIKQRFLHSSKYILLTKYRERIILDKQAIASLIGMKREFKTLIMNITPHDVCDLNYTIHFKE